MPHLGPGVLGVFQKAVPVALVLKTLRVGQHPRHQAAHRVRHRHSGDLPPGEDEVANRDFLIHALVDKPLVHALIVAAYEDQAPLLPGQPPGVRLGEGFATGREKNGAGPGVRQGADVLPTPVQRVGLEHRPPASAVGVVVHLLLLI